MNNAWKYIVWCLRIRRVEYRIAELPLFLIPMLLTDVESSAFLSAVFWEGLVAFLFLFVFGDLLNCLADRDLDATYKPHLSEAVYGIGIRGVLWQAILSGIAAVAITVHLAWMLDRWILVPMMGIGLFVALAYSVEPLRLKSRGLWQLAFYWAGLFVAPMIFAAMIFDGSPSWGVWAVAAAYGLVQTGVILVNTAEDYPEDIGMGVRTAIVALGLKPGIRLAATLTVLGSFGISALFVAIYLDRHGSGWAWLGLVPLSVTCVTMCVAVSRLARTMRSISDEEAIAEVKRTARWVPLWLASVGLGSLVAAAVWCFAR